MNSHFSLFQPAQRKRKKTLCHSSLSHLLSLTASNEYSGHLGILPAMGEPAIEIWGAKLKRKKIGGQN
jgi:hypothetical protein